MSDMRPRTSGNGLIRSLHNLYGGYASLYPAFMPHFLCCAYEHCRPGRSRGRGIDGPVGREFQHGSTHFTQEPLHAALRRGRLDDSRLARPPGARRCGNAWQGHEQKRHQQYWHHRWPRLFQLADQAEIDEANDGASIADVFSVRVLAMRSRTVEHPVVLPAENRPVDLVEVLHVTVLA